MKSTFTLIFKQEPEGGFTVIVPSLPGCVTYGKDLRQAREMAVDAICGYLTSLKKHNQEIPINDSIFLTTVDLEASKKGCWHA